MITKRLVYNITHMLVIYMLIIQYMVDFTYKFVPAAILSLGFWLHRHITSIVIIVKQ